jgi:hypothetical protein
MELRERIGSLQSKMPRHRFNPHAWRFGTSHTMAVIRSDQRTAAVRYAGWRPRAPGKREGGARKMKNPPADFSGRV